jgi:hypothetical protein
VVAVKVIRTNLAEDAAFRARFAREVAAARKVGGLFTAQVVDADLDGPVPWLVTAYIPGTSLADAVEQQGPLPTRSVLALAAGLAEGLSAIHAAGVIHRDLKPSPGFMSPEQAEGLTVGPSSDIFSLAGVLIYAMRGDGPFGTGDTAALLYRVVHGEPNLDQVPDDLRPLIRRSLSRDAARRPTATEFLTELSAAYPTAANLIDWLPPSILGLTGQRAASADTSVRQPAPAGDFGPAVTAGAAGVAGAMADPDEPLTIKVPPMGSPTRMPTDTDEPLTIRVPPIGQATQTSMASQPPQEAGGRPGSLGPDAHLAAAGSGYTGQQGDLGQQGYSGVPEYLEAQQYQAPQGHSPDQGYSGGLVAPGGPGTDQWYPPLRPGPGRKRPRWLLPTGVAALVVVVAAVALVLGGRSHQVLPGRPGPTSPTPATPSRSTSPSPDATPTVGDLQLTQFQVGDCLTGSNMDLNTNAPWPKTTLAVPCSQSHTAQVFYANSSFWPKTGAYPGNSTISKEAAAECDTAFASYVGIVYSKSKYTWTNIVPDSSTWPNGDRALHCIAYDATTQEPAGAPMTESIEGTRR